MSEFRIVDTNYFFDAATVLTGSSADTAFPVDNLTKYLRSKPWRTTGKTSENVVADLQTAEEIDSFGMFFHPLDGVKLSNSATLKLQANATNVWTSPAVDITLSIDFTHECVTHFFSTPQEYRYWRVTLADPATSYDYIEVAKIVLGKATQIQMPEIGFKAGAEDLSRIAETPYGARYADVFPTRRLLEFSFKALSEADKRLLRVIYERLGKVTPLMVALDPLQAVFTDKDEHVLYGYLDNDYEAAQAFLTYFDFVMAIKEGL